MTSITFEYQSVIYTMTTSATINADFSLLPQYDEQDWTFSPPLQVEGEVVSNPQELVKTSSGGTHYLMLDYYGSGAGAVNFTLNFGYHGSGVYSLSGAGSATGHNASGGYAISDSSSPPPTFETSTITFELESVTYTMTSNNLINISEDFSTIPDSYPTNWTFSPAALQIRGEVLSNPLLLTKSQSGSGNNYLMNDSSNGTAYFNLMWGYNGPNTYHFNSTIGGVHQNVTGTSSFSNSSTSSASGDPFITPILQ